MAASQFTDVLRVCTRCGEAKPATNEHFEPHKMGKHGLAPRCRPCRKIETAELRARPDQKARQKAWRDANKAKVREANRAYRAAGYKSTEAVAKWRRENLEQARGREAAAMRRRLAEDPAFALLCRMRGQLRRLACGKGGRRTEEVLGYTAHDLRRHLERQFAPGMGWHNMSEWAIDHIIPVAAFDIASVDCPEFKACWALTNLRPLWAADNQAKGAKVLTLL